MLNKVILIGNVGKDPECRIISDTFRVAKFTLATSEMYTDKSGTKQTKTEWHNIVATNKQAETIESYVKKGQQLYIEGKLTYNKYEKDGETKFTTEIQVERFYFLGKKESESTSRSQENDIPAEKQVPEQKDDLQF